MKYIPILNSRDAELSIAYYGYENVLPYIRVIKQKFRKNSKKDLADEISLKINSKYFIEIYKSTNPGNVQIDIAIFLKTMTDLEKYVKECYKYAKDPKATIVIPAKTIFEIPKPKLDKINNLATIISSLDELYFLEQYNINFQNYFIDFDVKKLTGLPLNIFQKFWQKNKDKIIFVFDNYKNPVRNIDADEVGKKITNTIKTNYLNFSTPFGISDYCFLEKDKLPSQGGMLSPGIKIQLDSKFLFLIGTNIGNIRDAKFSQYTDAVRNLYNSNEYKKFTEKLSGFRTNRIIKEVSETMNGSDSRIITPLKAKVISMDHYIILMKNILNI